MSANAAIPFFLNDPIVESGQKSPQGTPSQGSGDEAFDQYYNRAINRAREECCPSTKLRPADIEETAGAVVSGETAPLEEETSEGVTTPLLHDRPAIRENPFLARPSDSSFKPICDFRGHDLQAVESQISFAPQETAAQAIENPKQPLQRQDAAAVHPNGAAGYEINLSIFTQKKAFFAQSIAAPIDVDHTSQKNQVIFSAAEMGSSQSSNKVFTLNNDVSVAFEPPDEAFQEVRIAFNPMEPQDGIIKGELDNDGASDGSKAAFAAPDSATRVIRSEETQETAVGEVKTAGRPLALDSFMLDANGHPVQVSENQLHSIDFMPFQQTSEETPANEAHHERAPQGSDVEWKIQQAPEKPMRYEAAPSAVQPHMEKSGEESGDKNQKTIQIIRDAPGNFDVKNEMKQDSAGAGKDHSAKDQGGSEKNAALLQDLNRLFKAEKAADAPPFQPKAESMGKNSPMAANQNGVIQDEALGETRKANPAGLSLIKSREGGLSEAAQPSRPAPSGQINGSSEPAAAQSQPPAAGAPAPSSNGAAAAQPSSMVQH
ncbi:MAG: hypothetical protein ACP5I1_01780, partial [Candidatus Hinthialibacter sp.]